MQNYLQRARHNIYKVPTILEDFLLPARRLELLLSLFLLFRSDVLLFLTSTFARVNSVHHVVACRHVATTENNEWLETPLLSPVLHQPLTVFLIIFYTQCKYSSKLRSTSLGVEDSPPQDYPSTMA